MSDKKQFGLAIIGTGSIADTHAKAIGEIENAGLLGVYNRTKSRAEAFAAKYKCKCYDEIETMLENDEIDIVCICTPSGAHLEPALSCIKAGKHCLIEKPLEITTERCDKIIRAAHESGVKVGTIFPSRFYEGSQQLKQALSKNRFGALVLGDAYVKWNRTPEYYRSGKWRGTWKLDGGGALMNQGIHSVDLLQWYMGSAKSVQAISSRAMHKNIEVEDTIVAVVEFGNGALGTIECSTAVFPGSKKRIEIRGTEGSAILEGDELKAWEFRKAEDADEKINNKLNKVSATSGGASDPKDISYRGHQRQMEDMINAIEYNHAPAIDGEEGRKSVALIEAIYESAKTGDKVYI